MKLRIIVSPMVTDVAWTLDQDFIVLRGRFFHLF